MVSDNTFKCTAAGKFYKANETLSCNSTYVVYLIIYQYCKLQYVGSAITFKERFYTRKSDINTGKKRCDAAKNFLECCSN